MSDVFDKYYRRYDSWYVKNRFAFLSEVKALKKVVPSTGRGLEIGVGTGRFASCLGINYGIDASKNMLKIAKKRGIEVSQGRAEKLPFASHSFDYVALIITLCFVKNPHRVVAQAQRVLKKAGKIIIGIIDKNSFLGRFYQNKKSVFYKRAKFFGVQELGHLLKSAGFARISYYQSIYKLPNKIHSVQRPKGGFGEGGFVAISAQKAFSRRQSN